jgi:hypothetical protein
MRWIYNMKNICTIILIAVWLIPASLSGTAQEKEQTSLNNKTYALVVSGISKDPQDRSAKSKIVSDIKKLLLNNPEVTSETLIVLVADNTAANTSPIASTAENIQMAIKTIVTFARDNDRFIFYYIGQANVIGEMLRFNLPGTDITQEQLAQWIKEIQASSMLIVLDCPGSGLATKAMSGQGRVVICSCTAQQRYSTRFSEYFIPALADNKTDTNSEGKISVLEAFTNASREVDDWYRQKKLLTTETPVLEDNGDGLPSQQPWRYKLDGNDGSAASEFFLMR